MAFAGNVARYLEAVGETDTCDFAQRRVRLLGRRGIDAGADAAFLRAGLQSRHLVARDLRSSRLADKLVDRRHPSRTPSVNQISCQTPAPAIRHRIAGANWIGRPARFQRTVSHGAVPLLEEKGCV